MDRKLFITLLTKKISHELSEKEAALLNTAIAENAEYAQIARGISEYGHPQEDLTADYVQSKLDTTWSGMSHEAEIKPFYRNTAYPRLLKIAAVLLIMLALGFWLFNAKHRPTALAAVQMDTIQSGEQKLYTTLDDGTQVTLNKNSSVVYNRGFGKTVRHIILNGEAFFDVTSNPNVRLLLEAGNIHIEVKGTAFNVNAYKDNKNIEVILVRGLIEVINKYNKKNKVLLNPNQKLLAPAEKQANLLFNIRNVDTIVPVKQLPDTVNFRKEKLESLARLLEKKYTVTVTIQNEALKEKRFSGMFVKETLEEALDALKLSYPFNYTIQANQVIIE
ncbi:FecR family protein [Niabella aquatica]